MADRKAELEKKRQKLEELKKAREQKKKEAHDKELVGDIPNINDRRNTEDIFDTLMYPCVYHFV